MRAHRSCSLVVGTDHASCLGNIAWDVRITAIARCDYVFMRLRKAYNGFPVSPSVLYPRL